MCLNSRYSYNAVGITFQNIDFRKGFSFYSEINVRKMYINILNPLNHGGGRRTPLPPFLFAFYSKLSWGTHTWKFFTLQAFLLQMPLWKKNQEI